MKELRQNTGGSSQAAIDRRHTARIVELVPESIMPEAGDDIVDQVLDRLRKQLADSVQSNKATKSSSSQT